MKKLASQIFLFSCTLLLFTSVANANPVDVASMMYSGQDFDPINGMVDELGNRMPFPVDEWIDSSWVFTSEYACSIGPDNPQIPNVLVSIVNRTGRCWTDLWYVADQETTLSNFDKERINGMLAFKIDKRPSGVNWPLVYESMAQDSKFEPGEMWSFIIDDYVNLLGLPASALDSLGVPSGSPPSSGSIIAIPEPSMVAVLALGALALRRKK